MDPPQELNPPESTRELATTGPSQMSSTKIAKADSKGDVVQNRAESSQRLSKVSASKIATTDSKGNVPATAQRSESSTPKPNDSSAKDKDKKQGKTKEPKEKKAKGGKARRGTKDAEKKEETEDPTDEGKKRKSLRIDDAVGTEEKKMSINLPSRSSLRASRASLRATSSLRFRLSFRSKSMISMDEYSTDTSEEESMDKTKIEASKKHGKKKEKKGKKQKAKSVIFEKGEDLTAPIPEPPPPTAVQREPEPEKKDDMMAEITKMKAAAEAGEEYVTPPEQAPQKKKPPKKKKTKKVKITAEMAEKMRVEAELEAARLAELEKKRLEEERKAAIEKEKRDVVEQRFRIEQLVKTNSKLEDMVTSKKEQDRQEKELAEWEFYIACGRLPNPSLCDQMNTYLHLWEYEMDSTTMDVASKRTGDVVKLLEDLQDLLDTAEHVEMRTVENWKWVRQLFRDHQSENLEVATYRLLRNIQQNLTRIDIPTADFNFDDENVNLSIWLRVQLPIPLPNPRRPPKSRIDVDFPNVKMQVLFPISIDCDCMAIRSVYLKYDHLSDLSDNFYMPPIPPFYSAKLLDVTNKEWRNKLKYKYENRDIKPDVPKLEDGPENEPKVEEKEKEKTEFASDEEIPLVPYKKLQPSASETVIYSEDIFYADINASITITVPDYVINLRKFSILGGAFCLNLLYQPPQPQHFVTMNMLMTKLFLPKKLEHVDFSVTYTPPAPPPPGVRRLPEEIEEEMRLQEEEMDKLMSITLTWPSHVIFLELPIVCFWDENERVWTKKNIHDLKHNEEKGVLTFRTGRFGTYGLATIRYVNLPYQAWELKPEEDGTVTFQITAAILMLEFNVNKEGLICLSQLQNSPNRALTEIVGRYFKLFKLKRKMQEAGIDIFPEGDAFCYIEGACEKQWPMERHLYYNMAQLAPCFNFAWSRWNATAGRRNIVFQMREYLISKSKQKNHHMALVTPQKASFIECTEVSQVFCSDDTEGLKFSADLYHLIKATHSITVRKKAQSSPWQLIYALYELLVYVRVLSFS